MLLGVPFLLVVRQPDLGTALVLVPVLGATLVGIGMRMKVLGGLRWRGWPLMPLAWFVLKPYQRDRLLVYLDPFRDPLGTAYNVIQAKIAIGSGQLLGKGIGGATQSRLAFLPERHTDFIFAVFAEMWGFLGCLVLIVAYGLLVLRGFEIAAGTRETRGRILALGVTTVFAAQILINHRDGDGPAPHRGDPAAADELRRIVHGGLADGAGSPPLDPNAAVPLTAALRGRVCPAAIPRSRLLPWESASSSTPA